MLFFSLTPLELHPIEIFQKALSTIMTSGETNFDLRYVQKYLC